MMKNDREQRFMEFRMEQEEAPSYEVRGYASTFETYKMYTDDSGIDYFERIDPHAFDDADLSDVVFRIDHEGAVYARTSAGTVELWTDEHGLGNRTDLSKTQKARLLLLLMAMSMTERLIQGLSRKSQRCMTSHL